MNRILDQFSRPIESEAKAHQNGRAGKNGSSSTSVKGGMIDALVRSLGELETMTPAQRARDPMKNHAWSFIAAFAIAKAAPPFAVFTETGAEVERRRAKALARGDRNWTPKCGAHRTAVDRWLSLPSAKLAAWRNWSSKSIEIDAEHPLALLFKRPNRLQMSRQFWMSTLMMIAAKGDARWVLRGGDFGPAPINGIPTEIWPTTPKSMKAIQSGGSGELVGWEWTIPNGLPGGGGGRKVNLLPHEVIRFHFADPDDYLSAIAPIAAAASAIERDMLADTSNRDLMQNDCTPRGVVMTDLPLSPEQETEFKQAWEERHRAKDGGGGRTAFMSGGTKYLPVGLTPQEMGFKDVYELDRIATLAALGVMPSSVGLSEGANYATDLAQRLNFYDRTVLPILGLIEETLDGTLFELEADTVFGMFDRSRIEALRAGTEQKAQTAKVLAGVELRMPPKQAFKMVGLDVEDYETDDIAMISPMLAPAEDVASGAAKPPTEPGASPAGGNNPAPESEDNPTPGTGDGVDDTDNDGGSGAGDDEVRSAERSDLIGKAIVICRQFGGDRGRSPLRKAIAKSFNIEEKEAERELRAYSRRQSPWFRLQGQARKAAAAKRHVEFLKMQGDLEDRVSPKYRAWVREVREITLKKFDRAAKGLTPAVIAAILKAEDDVAQFELSAVLPDVGETKSSLRATTRPTFNDALGEIYEFTLDDIGGVPVFEIDDARIVRYFDNRIERFAGMTTQGVISRVRDSLTRGMQAGETIQEMRLRIGHVFDTAASSYKTLQVARTETAGFANGMRNEMFVADGWGKATWDSADDEHVRDTHVVYGEAGPQAIGFNFLELVGRTDGVLRFPGDGEAPAGEVVNCRCFHLPES